VNIPSLACLTIFGIGLTGAAYVASLAARRRYPSPLTTPVLFSTAVVIAVLSATHISFEDYRLAKAILTFFLGPATVALAIPLYKNRHVFSKNLGPFLAGLCAGSIGTMIAAGLTARIFGLAPELISSISIKSATVPIAVEIAGIVQGVPALTAIFVVLTGIIGAAFGPWILDRCRITDPLSRGLALGTISHGQGTAQAATETEFTGAVAGVATGLGAVCTSLAAPYLVPLLVG
jgi:predicted murein hydrolase (TIGR00659 family)